jgi:hypothetical protein
MTPALKLLTLVWKNCKKDTWERINHSMRNALNLAIGSGLRFKATDFNVMASEFRWNFWVSESAEWIYTEAIINGNSSCVQAWEEHTGRTPFFANQVECHYVSGGYLHASTIIRQREKLAVNLAFKYQDTLAWVTGFDDKNGIMRAAVYQNRHRDGKPKKLLRLSHDQLKSLCPAKKKSSQAVQQ